MNTNRLPATLADGQLPPELLRSVPRQVVLTAGGKAAVVIVLVLTVGALGGGVWLYVSATRDAARFKLLESQSVFTQAEVVKLGRVEGEEKRRVVTYQYTFQGQAYSGAATLRRSAWQKLDLGSRIVVRYVPSNPGVNWMPGHEPRGVPLWTVPVFPACAAFAAFLIAYSLRRQRALLSEGRAALARVTHCDRARKGDHRGHRVHYEFKILSGATRTGHYDAQKSPPVPGTMLTVVYDPEQPQRNARYPFSLVRTSV